MSVLLYSGGLDAYCIDKIYEPDLLLFVDSGTQEAAREWQLILEADNGISFNEGDIEYVEMDFLSRFEGDDKIIPFRNTFFAMAGTMFDSYVMLGATEGDGVDTDDTTNAWASSVEAAINQYADVGDRYTVDLPARSMTKEELVARAVEKPGVEYVDILENTKSCHYGTVDEGCGRCFGCLRRWTAFKAQDDFPDIAQDYFADDPVNQYERKPQKIVNNFAARGSEFQSFIDALDNRGYDVAAMPDPWGESFD